MKKSELINHYKKSEEILTGVLKTPAGSEQSRLILRLELDNIKVFLAKLEQINSLD